jgi:hypothetical protein
MTSLVSDLHCKQSLKVEERMSSGYESWETGVVVESAELVGGQATTAHALQATGTHSSSATSWVCEEAARAAGRVVGVSTFVGWVGLRAGWEVASKAAESSEVILCQAGDCGCVSVAVGVAGSRDARRYSGQRTDARAGVVLGGCGAQDDHFRLRARVSRHGWMQACQVVAMGCQAIEVVEVWAVRFGDEAGSMLGMAALQRQDDIPSAAVGVEWERQCRQADAAREVVVRCPVGRLMRAVCFRLAVLQGCHSTSC